MFDLRAAGRRRNVKRKVLPATILLTLAACERGPSADEIQAAYRDHLRHDAEEAALVGVSDDHPGDLITTARQSCEADGNSHYHCVVRFAVEITGKRTTLDRSLHLVPGEHGWEVDSVEDVAEN